MTSAMSALHRTSAKSLLISGACVGLPHAQRAGMRATLRILIPLFISFLLTSTAAGARQRKLAERRSEDPEECLRLASRDDVLIGTGGLTSADRAIGSVRIWGHTMADDALWDLIGGPPALPLSPEQAIALVSRLAQTGLFATVEPKVTLGEETAQLEIALSENLRVTSVQVRGLSEFRTE